MSTTAHTIQVRNGNGWETVRPASSRSNGRRDVRKLAERTGVQHRLVEGDGWDEQAAVVLVAGQVAEEAAPRTPEQQDDPAATPAGSAPDGLGDPDTEEAADPAHPMDAYRRPRVALGRPQPRDLDQSDVDADGQRLRELAAARAPEQDEQDEAVEPVPAEPAAGPARKVDHVARHVERTARGPMLQSRYLGQDEWDDVRSWDCLYRGRRGGRGLVKKGMGAQEARLVRQDTGEVIWSSADDPELVAYFAAQDADYEAAAAARVEGSYLGAR